MKLYGLYYHDNVSNLEYNHRKFCDANNMQYSKFKINNIAHKYYMMLQLLQKNIGETLIFIDSYSYFKNFDFNFSLNLDGLVQEHKDKKYCLDNFLIIKSNNSSIKIIKRMLQHIAADQYIRHNINPNLLFPSEWKVNYPFKQNDKYLNVDVRLHDNSLTLNNTLVNTINLHEKYQDHSQHSLADFICNYSPRNYSTPDEKFTVVNPGKSKALVTLYTDNIKNYGAISECNISRYCIENDITFYIYRDLPEELSNMSGNWCKPYLMLKHIDQHQHIAWIDSDILISKKYKFDWGHEICVYSDPVAWFFNSGYVCLQNTDKNKDLLNLVIKYFSELGNLDSVYVHGGDQTYFIKAVNELYPDFIPFSNEYGNSHYLIPTFRLPTDPVMIHFMGIENHLRAAIMDYYEQKINEI